MNATIPLPRGIVAFFLLPAEKSGYKFRKAKPAEKPGYKFRKNISRQRRRGTKFRKEVFMAKIDFSKIEGYEEMTAEEKLAALEGFEIPEPD